MALDNVAADTLIGQPAYQSLVTAAVMTQALTSLSSATSNSLPDQARVGLAQQVIANSGTAFTRFGYLVCVNLQVTGGAEVTLPTLDQVQTAVTALWDQVAGVSPAANTLAYQINDPWCQQRVMAILTGIAITFDATTPPNPSTDADDCERLFAQRFIAGLYNAGTYPKTFTQDNALALVGAGVTDLYTATDAQITAAAQAQITQYVADTLWKANHTPPITSNPIP